MKAIAFVLLGLSQFTGLAQADEWDVLFSAPPSDARAIIHLSTDATTIACDIFATVDDTNALTGLGFTCSNHPDEFTRYTLDQLRAGIVFNKDSDFPFISSNINLVTISGPNVTAAGGGEVNVHYVSNALAGTYKDYPFELEPYSGAWATFTPQDAGHQRFDQLFLKKKTSLGAPIGIDCVSVSLSPDQPGSC